MSVIWYYLYIALLTAVLVLWIIIAFRDDGPGDTDEDDV